MLHAALVQELIMDEQMAAVDGSSVVRKRRTGNRKRGAELLQKELDDRADISARGRVERRAIFEIELPAADGFQPMERVFGFAHGLLDGTGTCLQRDDHSVDLLQAAWQILGYRSFERFESRFSPDYWLNRFLR